MRPAAIFLDPRIGPLLSRTFDEAAERALIRRAQRTGLDLRGLERAAIGWAQDGAVYLGAGPIDTTRVTERLWERLLPPRRRARDEVGNQRVEGTLGNTVVSLLVVPSCGSAGYGEGALTRSVDQLVGTASGRDPDALLVWHTEQVPIELARAAGAALVRQVQSLNVEATAETPGLRVSLSISGPLTPDAPGRVQRAIDGLIASPLGELTDARSWLAGTPVRFDTAAQRLEARIMVPWRALAALADAMRGDVGAPSSR